MKTNSPQWIVATDQRTALLYSCEGSAGTHWHLDQQRQIRNPWENDHEHHRPSALGRGPAANAAQHFASTGHESEEESHRFAREVSAWITRSRQELGIDHLHVFASTRFLGMLRHEIDARQPVTLHDAELTTIPPGALGVHTAVRSALERSILTAPRSG